MAFLNLDGVHVNPEHFSHVAESGDDVTVTFANGTTTVFTGENAAAIRKAVGAHKAKVEHKAEPHGHKAH